MIGDWSLWGRGLTWSGLKNPISALSLRRPALSKSGMMGRSCGTTRRVSVEVSGSAGATGSAAAGTEMEPAGAGSNTGGCGS